MAYTLAEALSKLGSPEYSTFEQLLELVQQTSITPTNAVSDATTLLYSGDLSEDVKAWQVANTISNSSYDSNGLKQVITIADTPAGQLLEHADFRAALSNALDGDADLIKYALDGVDANGNRIDTGLWDDVSQRLAQNATGDVRTIVAPNASSSSVFSQTELKVLLDTEASPNVTHINGIPREDLIRLRSDLLATGTTPTLADIETADRILLDCVKYNSAEQIAGLKLSLAKDGKTIVAVGTKEFFNRIGLPGTGVDLPTGHTGVSGTSLMTVTQTSEQLSNARLANDHLKLYAQEHYNLAQVAGDATKMATFAKYLNKLGIAGDILSLAIIANQANAAYENGDVTGAQHILQDWAAEYVGGLAGGLLAASLVGSALAPLCLTGPAGAFIAGVFTLTAGLLGGIIGGEAVSELLNKARSLFLASDAQGSPLILDLDGDGVETTALANGIQFDHDTNGFAEKTAWVGTDDGLIVRDINGNGTIDSGTELFGNNTILKNGQKASNGFAALADLDGNLDGKINANDTAYNQLRVWKDANGDGITDQGELITLADAGVQSITTTYTTSTTVDANGNEHKQRGTFTRTDGTTAAVDDVWFRMDAMYAIPHELLAETDEIAGLPDLQGAGVLHSLHQAMLRDVDGTIKQLVEQFSAATDTGARKTLMEQLLYALAGVSDRNPVRSDYGGYGNGHQIAVLEKLFADSYKNGAGSSGAGAQPLLDQSWQMVFNLYYSQLMAQTHLKPLYSAINYTWDTEAQAIHGDLTPVIAELQNLLATDRTAGLVLFEEFTRSLDILQLTGMVNFDDYKAAFVTQGETFSSVFEQLAKNNIYGSWGSDGFSYTSADDAIYAYSGNETLFGGVGNDYLDGGSGDDILNGDVDDDILAGGIGKDTLIGGAGNDTYRFGIGSGRDVIMNHAADSATAVDTVAFGDGIAVGDLELYKNGSDLQIYIRGTSESLTIQSWFNNDTYKVDRFSFTDGATINAEQMEARTILVYGTDGMDSLTGSNVVDLMYGYDGADYLYGRAGNDHLEGGSGDDNLQGEDGDDILVGGLGDDRLTGGSGNDTYLFEFGNGTDIISNYAADHITAIDVVAFGEGIVPADLILFKDGCDLRININNSTDVLIIQSWFNGDQSKIDQFRFSDGSVMTAAQIDSNTVRVLGSSSYDSLAGSSSNDLMYGLDGNDSLSGGTGNDLLDGGSGNDSLSGEAGDDLLDGGAGTDTLNGGAGNDTYRFSLGSETDTISNNASDYATTVDTVEFGAGITAADIELFKDNYNLRVVVKGTADALIIQNWFSSAAYKVDQFRFSDGSLITASQLEDLGYTIYTPPVSLNLVGTTSNDSLIGGLGNDILNGNDGDDILDGSAGNDTLTGGAGNDTYQFGIGSDTINNNATDYATATDTIAFSEGITASDLEFFKESSSLHIEVTGTSDVLIVQNWFSGDAYKIDQFKFGDGTILTAAQIDAGGFKLYGTGDNESLVGSSSDDLIYGNDGNDTLSGGDGNDDILGGVGNDVLNGNNGNDMVDGGNGNDTLNGGTGNDIYKFGFGSGTDTINNYVADYATTVDTVEFGEGIAASDVTFFKEDWNLRLAIKDTTDSLIIQSWFVGDSYKVDQFRFADGTMMSAAQIGACSYNIYGTGGNDILAGSSSPDLIYGNNGNDQINGGDGDDIMDGGNGNDSLVGGIGNDTYLFGRGSGTDMINNVPTDYATTIDSVAFGADIAPDGLDFIKDGNNLRISVTGTPDSLSILNWFIGDRYEIDQFTFADGSVISAAQVDTKTFNQYGTSGNDALNGSNQNDRIFGYEADDTITGGTGDDLLDGGQGNDTLIGGDGNDTYLFGRGSSVDLLRNSSADYATSIDTIQFGEDVFTEDIEFFKYNGYLCLNIKGTNDSLMIEGWFSANYNKVDQFKFSDGSVLSAGQMDAKGYKVYGTIGNETIAGSEANDRLSGYEGDDILSGYGGDDLLNGGGGYDWLDGGIGDDTYIFGIGSGLDTISNFAADYATAADIVAFGEGIFTSDLDLFKESNNLRIAIKGTADSLVIQNWFSGERYEVDLLRFDDGNCLSAAQVNASSFVAYGAGGGDTLSGSNFNDLMYGLYGNDYLYGASGDDYLDGGSGNDIIQGQDGSDVLVGGDGNDTLIGGAGNDTYRFGVGSGTDTINDYYTDYATSVDRVEFGQGITFGDIDLLKEGNNLRMGVKGTADSLIIQSWFNGAQYKPDQFSFSDGNIVSAAQMDMNRFSLFGTVGNDSLSGSNSDDLAYGYDGDDQIYGRMGNDSLDGASGNDTIQGEDGNDILDGGAGNDSLNGGTGNDTYIFGIGSGIDTINDCATDYAVATNVVEFGGDIVASSLELFKENNNLRISIKGTEDALIIQNWFSGTAYNVDQFRFSDGSVLTSGQIDSCTFQIPGSNINDSLFGSNSEDIMYGFDGNDSLSGRAGDDVINGNGGSDHLYGEGGNDVLHGNEGDDWLYGNSGDDILNGSTGSDYLQGETGSDLYLFGRDDGVDTVYDYDATTGNTDIARFNENIATDQLWFQHVGSNLEVSIIGTSDKFTIQNWYSGSQYHVEQFKTADGKTLADSNVESLVSAMASFAVPGSGQTVLPQNYQETLAPMIAANWQ